MLYFMKTNQLWAGILLATAIFSANAQTTIQTSGVTSFGVSAGTVGTNNTYYGVRAGNVSAAGTGGNVFIGHDAGRVNTFAATANYNTFLGLATGYNNTKGGFNTFLGGYSGNDNIEGSYNTFLGYRSGFKNTGSSNVYLGFYAGYNSILTSNNTFVGNYAGFSNTGSQNVFLGANAGYNCTESNRLFIDNGPTSTPLIWGDFTNDILKLNGKVGIGLGTTAFPATAGGLDVSAYKLIVNGGILATQVRVATTWADYVFANNYALPKLSEVDSYIKQNGHLPNMPSAKTVEAQGIEVGEMAKMQQEKIEELTLYAIQQQKQIEKQQQELDELKAMVKQLAASKQ